MTITRLGLLHVLLFVALRYHPTHSWHSSSSSTVPSGPLQIRRPLLLWSQSPPPPHRYCSSSNHDHHPNGLFRHLLSSSPYGRSQPRKQQRRRYLSSFLEQDTPNHDDEDDQDGDRLSDEELQATLGEWDPSKPQLNTVHLTGRIGSDPEPRYLEDGKVVINNLSLAVRRKYHNMERQYLKIASGQEETDWYGLEIWGQTAEFVSKYVDRGMRVGVIGSLQVDEWIDKETQEPRNRVKVIVRDFDILETRSESEARRGSSGGGSGGSSSRRGPAFYTSENDSSAGTGGFFDD